MKQSGLLNPHVDKCLELCNERYGYQMAIKMLCEKFGLDKNQILELARNRDIAGINKILKGVL